MSRLATALPLPAGISTTTPSDPADLVLVSAKFWTGGRTISSRSD